MPGRGETTTPHPAATAAVTETIPVGAGPQYVRVSPDGKVACDAGSGAVSVGAVPDGVTVTG